MNNRSKCIDLAGGVIGLLLTLTLNSAALADDDQPLQWKQPSEEQVKQMRAMIEKSRVEKKGFATKEQLEELNKLLAPMEERLRALELDANKLRDLHRKAMEDANVLVTRNIILKAINIHRAFRSVFFEKISTISAWGESHHRESCVQQAAKEKAYLTPISDRWLATMPTMPLGELLQRYTASEYVEAGELMGYTMGMGRWGADRELNRLYGVCSGVAESEPGSD